MRQLWGRVELQVLVALYAPAHRCFPGAMEKEEGRPRLQRGQRVCMKTGPRAL